MCWVNVVWEVRMEVLERIGEDLRRRRRWVVRSWGKGNG